MQQFPQTPEHTTTVYVLAPTPTYVECRCGAKAPYDNPSDAIEAAETHRYVAAGT